MITSIVLYSDGQTRFDPHVEEDRITVLSVLYPRLTRAELRELDQSMLAKGGWPAKVPAKG